MSIKIEHPDTGEEMEVFTPEEVEIQKAEALATSNTEWEEKISATTGELETLKKFQAEQKDNFKRLKDMTEEEKAQLSAKQIEDQKVIESLFEKNAELETLIKDRDAREVNAIKESLINKFTGEDPKAREALESKLTLLSSIEDMGERIKAAATLAGLTSNIQSENPLYRESPTGMAPGQMADKKDSDKFLGSDKGRAALERMGMSDKKDN